MTNSRHDPRGSVSCILVQAAAASESAVAEIWQRYFPRLVAVARNTLRHLPHRMEDANDAAQSAFISFWQQLSKDGVSASLNRNSLWKLLTTITVRKVRSELRKQMAEKRGEGRVRRFSELADADSDSPVNDLLSVIPSQEFDLACEEWLALLPEEQRQFAVLRLFGHTNREISELLNCTERKVERKLHLIRECWNDADTK